MSRILCAWELGGGYGHVNRLAEVGGLLHAQGHRIYMALRDPRVASYLALDRRFVLLQAPLRNGGRDQSPPALNYADLLIRCGGLDDHGLRGRVRAWLGLYELVGPDLLLLDHAPTALLAARIAGIRRATLGTGFQSPPRIAPMPCLQPWRGVDPSRLRASEEQVLAAFNRTLADLGGAPLGVLADLFDVDEDFLCTLPVLDHYGPRDGSRYWGPVAEAVGLDGPGAGVSAELIFVYVGAEYPALESLLGQLRGLEWPVLVHIRGLDAARARSLGGGSVTVAARPVDLAEVVGRCRLAVCHGGHGTVAAMALAGVPLLLLPEHLEQALLSYRLVRQGVGLMADPSKRDHDFAGAIRSMLATGRFAENAGALAATCRSFDPRTALRAIAARCQELIA